MSLSSTTDRVSYAGNGATLAFSFPYKFFADADLVVLVKVDSTGVETTKTLTTHYTCSGAGVEAGGTVTMVTAPATGETLIIYRDKSAIQELDIGENGKIPSDNLEKQIDKLVMMIQRNKNKLARGITLPEGFIASFSTVLPGLMVNNGYLKTTSTGTGLEYISQATLINTISTGLQAFTASRALVSNSSGLATVSVTTDAEIAFISGLTSAVQTQINTKQTRSVLTTKGDLYVATASDTVARQAVGADDKVLTAASSQTNGVDYHTLLDADMIQNLSVANSVASNALTIALKTAAGSDASATDPIKIAFRSATLTTGTISLVKVTAALSGVVASGATLGHVNAQDGNIFVGVLNNAGTPELCWSTRPWDENALISTTAAGAGSTSATVIYSTTARSNVASRIVTKLISNQTTAGTWAAVPTNISVGSAPKVLAYLPPTIQTLTSSGTYTLPTSPRKPLWINVRMVGGGGGGGGSGTGTSGGTGGNGGNSTFGSSLLTANGGGGAANYTAGTPGTGTLSAPAINNGSFDGQYGQGGQTVLAGQTLVGGIGGSTMLGLGGPGTIAGPGPAVGYGSGGAGGQGSGAVNSGAGGGSAASINAIITNPSATYAYAVGAAGTAGTGGTSGAPGAVGGIGTIIVTEFYQ